MKKFPLIILTPISKSGTGIHDGAYSGKIYKDLETSMNTISSLNRGKSLSNFRATQ